MTAVEALRIVMAKRQEHQDPSKLKATAGETAVDFQRAGLEWIAAASREHGLELDDVVAAMEELAADTCPNLNALAAIGGLHVDQLAEAGLGAGLLTGILVGLELAK